MVGSRWRQRVGADEIDPEPAEIVLRLASEGDDGGVRQGVDLAREVMAGAGPIPRAADLDIERAQAAFRQPDVPELFVEGEVGVELVHEPSRVSVEGITGGLEGVIGLGQRALHQLFGCKVGIEAFSGVWVTRLRKDHHDLDIFRPASRADEASREMASGRIPPGFTADAEAVARVIGFAHDRFQAVGWFGNVHGGPPVLMTRRRYPSIEAIVRRESDQARERDPFDGRHRTLVARNPSAFARSGFRSWKTECHATLTRVQKGGQAERWLKSTSQSPWMRCSRSRRPRRMP